MTGRGRLLIVIVIRNVFKEEGKVFCVDCYFYGIFKVAGFLFFGGACFVCARNLI